MNTRGLFRSHTWVQKYLQKRDLPRVDSGEAGWLQSSGKWGRGLWGHNESQEWEVHSSVPTSVLYNRVLSISCNEVSAQEGATVPQTPSSLMRLQIFPISIAAQTPWPKQELKVWQTCRISNIPADAPASALRERRDGQQGKKEGLRQPSPPNGWSLKRK